MSFPKPGRSEAALAPLLALAYSTSVYALFQQEEFSDTFAVLSLGFLCVTPVLVGALIGWFTPTRLRSPLAYAVLVPCLVNFLFWAVAWLLFRELLLCVFIAAPVVLILTAGSSVGMYLLRRERSRARSEKGSSGTMGLFFLGLGLFPLVVTPLELRTTPPTAVYTVSTSIHIQASPETVWRHIIRVAEIQPAEQRWSAFHLAGVPEPLEAVLLGEGVGATRYGRFAGELLFAETITVWQPEEAVHFTIEPLHTSGTVMQYQQIGRRVYDIQSAAYRIEPLQDGSIILYLEGTYSLSSYFNGYGRLWMDAVMRDFQEYILEIVRRRAEAAEGG